MPFKTTASATLTLPVPATYVAFAAAAAATTASTAATAAMAAAAATSATIFTSMHAYGGDHDALQSAGTMGACMMVIIIIVRGLRAGGPCSGDENDEKISAVLATVRITKTQSPRKP